MAGIPLKILFPSPKYISECALAIGRGELVVMPTETVYGLAADALNPAAVERVFRSKGRPSDNPLIVHIASLDQIGDIVAYVPEEARILASAFWPGPLTLVLPKNPTVPDSVTAGLSTVAVRIPYHPVALALLRAVGRPLCAPSANRFMALSPTRAEDVDLRLDAYAVLDGGPCAVGIESTVLDLSGPEPTVLRLGQVGIDALSQALGKPVRVGAGHAERRSPGQYPKHYSPTTPLEMVDRLGAGQPGILFSAPSGEHQIEAPREPEAFARMLYSALHHLDEEGFDRLFIERPPETPEWAAVWDRLKRATGVP